MQWVELSLNVKEEEVYEVSSLVGHFGQGGAIIEEWPDRASSENSYFVKIYLPHTRSYKKDKLKIEGELNKLPGNHHMVLKERLLKPEDWFAYIKKQFTILEVGEKLTIKATWADSPSFSNRKVIELDPGYAFGTGLHPTTRLCLIHLEKMLQPGMSVLDLGTGSGILSIAAAKLGAGSVLALDTDANAIYAAKNNIRANSTANIVQVKRGTLSQRAQRTYQGTFDLVVANITAAVIANLGHGFFKVLKINGILIVSGINSPGLDEVLIRLAIADFKIDSIVNDREWYVVVARRIKV
jgi:ribosomal protein L11 methyltransferase